MLKVNKKTLIKKARNASILNQAVQVVTKAEIVAPGRSWLQGEGFLWALT